MRFSHFILAAVLPLIAAAAPVENAVAAPAAALGGPQVCTNGMDGRGGTNYQVTKDCCAQVKHAAYFNEVQKQCIGHAGSISNAVDTGAMVRCCTDRRTGSHAENVDDNIAHLLNSGGAMIGAGSNGKGGNRGGARGGRGK